MRTNFFSSFVLKILALIRTVISAKSTVFVVYQLIHGHDLIRWITFSIYLRTTTPCQISVWLRIHFHNIQLIITIPHVLSQVFPHKIHSSATTMTKRAEHVVVLHHWTALVNGVFQLKQQKLFSRILEYTRQQHQTNVVLSRTTEIVSSKMMTSHQTILTRNIANTMIPVTMTMISIWFLLIQIEV